PTIVETLIETIKALAAAGMGLLVVEQNLGVATALADRVIVMVSGSIAAETTSAALLADPDPQKRYLGGEPLAGGASAMARRRLMRRLALLCAMVMTALAGTAGTAAAQDPRFDVLVFSKTTGFRHTDAIDAGKVAIAELGAARNFSVTATEDATQFTDANL